MIKHTRVEKTVNSADPTSSIEHQIHIGPLSIYVGSIWDITSRTYFRNRQILFTSPRIHKHINKFMEKIYNSQEDKHQYNKEEEYDCPDFCFYCGCVDLVTSGGYVGEDIVTCRDCHQVLWCEPVTERMLA